MESQQQRTWRRRRLIVYPEIQYKLMGLVLVFSTILVVFFYSSFSFVFAKLESQATELGIENNQVLFEFLSQQQTTIEIWLGLSLILFAIVTCLGLMTFTNRVVGPIYHLELHLKKIIENNQLTPIRFRLNDHFGALEESFNHMVHNSDAFFKANAERPKIDVPENSE